VFLFSLQAALLSLTGLFGNLVGGRLPDWTGSLRTTMLAGSLLLGISVLPLLFVGPGRARPQPHTIPAAGSFSLFFKLLLPHGLIGLGAGLVMPFLNLYIKWKFNLDYDELGYLFGFSSVLTAAGIMVQPGLAHRYGKVRAILITQAFSLPFLLILGFVPVFALVCVAMLIRNMLMNMATPITSAFFMEQVPPQRRATLSVMAIMSWNLGWAISTAFSGWFRSLLDPDPGFKLAFGGMAFCYILSIAAFYVFWGRPSRIMHNIECVS
jgi:MFS family permease